MVSGAGEMKAKYIVHAVGPRFQEENLVEKLQATIRNSLAAAEKAGVTAIAFPPMGAGFYGVPLEQSAAITISSLAAYLQNGRPKITEIFVCANDNREFKPLKAELAQLSKA
ncbi:MAG: macro domain-containing protein [bacterium]